MHKKILYYETGSGYGGSAVSLYRLVKCLRTESIQPFVLVHGIGPKIRQLQEIGVTVRVLRHYHPIPEILRKSRGRISSGIEGLCFYGNFALNAILNGLRISRIIKKCGIDLVHMNNGIFENFPALIAAKMCKVPCVTHVRGTEPLTKLERLFGSWVSKVITLNRDMNNLYGSVFGKDKTCVVWNGIDVDSFSNPDKDKLRREYLGNNGHFAVGTVARLIPGKGLPEFIRAAAEVLKVRNDVSFFVIGDDPLSDRSFERQMKQLATNLGISEQLTFTGWRDDVIDLMAGLDLIVQCSTFTEGMSLTPIEAMALGRPVITSDVPGYVDTVQDKVTGFIVAAGDVPSLAGEILHLATDRQLASQLGTRGRERALNCFDARVTARRIEEIYESVLSQRRRLKICRQNQYH